MGFMCVRVVGVLWVLLINLPKHINKLCVIWVVLPYYCIDAMANIGCSFVYRLLQSALKLDAQALNKQIVKYVLIETP